MPTTCQILYSEEAQAHLRALQAGQRALLRDKIPEQLLHQPTVETTNRKPMRPNSLASWELRVQELRVYYDVMEQLQEPCVYIVAIGVKVRNKVIIAGEETQL